MSSFFAGGSISQNSMVGQQRQQISELQFDKFPDPESFLVWKTRFEESSDLHVLIFHRKQCYRSKKWRWLIHLEEFEVLAIRFWKIFPNFEMLDAKIGSALNKIIQNSQFKKKVSVEEQKAQKEDRFLRGRQIAFMICDYIRITGAHHTVLRLCGFFLCHSS